MEPIGYFIDALSRLGARLPVVLRNPTEQELRDLVQQRVAAAGSPRDKAAANAGTTRQTLTEWEKKPDLRLSQWAALARASGEAIVFRLDPDPEDTTKQAPRPEWAEGLEASIAQEVVNLLAAPDQVEAAIAGVEHLAELQRQLDAQHDGETEPQDQVGSKP